MLRFGHLHPDTDPYLVWQYGLSRYLGSDTNLDRFLVENPEKSLYFVNRHGVESSKVGYHFRK